MNKLENINEFEHYIIKRKQSDAIILYSIVGFIVMGIAILYFAINNKKLKANNEVLQENLTELQEERRRHYALLNDTLTSLQRKYNRQMDSINANIVFVNKLRDENVTLLENQYKKVLDIVKESKPKVEANVKKIVESDKIILNNKIDQSNKKSQEII
jgi:hypothetical protein